MSVVFPTRLYAILDVELAASKNLTPEAVMDAWLGAGVRLIQLRAKSMPSGPLLELAGRLVQRAGAAGAELVVNDRADIARMSGAAGVHVGQTDLPASDVRLLLGPHAFIGLSTHSGEQARLATAQPVDYIAIGPVFATSTKERPDPVVGLEGVRAASELAAIADRPAVGIGGITLETAPAVVEAGAAAVAVISDLLTDDPERRARAFLNALG